MRTQVPESPSSIRLPTRSLSLHARFPTLTPLAQGSEPTARLAISPGGPFRSYVLFRSRSVRDERQQRKQRRDVVQRVQEDGGPERARLVAHNAEQ